jgi:hypothetical protein
MHGKINDVLQKTDFVLSHIGCSTLLWYHKLINEYFILQLKCITSEYSKYIFQRRKDSHPMMGKCNNTQLF